jgi:Chaperone of endosialidase
MRKQALRVLSAIVITICLGAIPAVRAVNPPPDGNYPTRNTVEGEDALFSLDSGSAHTAIGYHAMHNFVGVRGNYGLTAVGSMAVDNSVTTGRCDAIGFQALRNSTDGLGGIIAIGANTLTTLGSSSLSFDDVAVGANALSALFQGVSSCAVGSGALQNVHAGYCVALGYKAVGEGSPGGPTVAVGSSAYLNGNGLYTVALGARALSNLTDDSDGNIAIGYGAGRKLVSNSAHNIEIGNPGKKGDNATIRLGTRGTHMGACIAGISGVSVTSGAQVVINNRGQLGILTSSARYKKAIRPMASSSEVIYSLRPVTYRYKKALDPAGRAQFGLVAEQLAKVAPELVAYDEQGKPYSVRYQAVNAMLLNEFQKDTRKAEAQDTALQAHEQELGQLEARIATLDADLGH